MPIFTPPSPALQKAWWKETIVYQIYPRSFKDSNDDGIGDLNGITEKLDYLHGQGIETLWLNPIFASPNADNGYDISDYRQIMPDFGTMEDFDRLLKETHARGMRLLLDLVLNHTSDQHPWFREARTSRENPYYDYYLWWPEEQGHPPYRKSHFDEKGDAWCYNAPTRSYYLHYFARQQPDLNWQNAQVRAEFEAVLRFWLDRGVDGFRVDVAHGLVKREGLPSWDEDTVMIDDHGGEGDLPPAPPTPVPPWPPMPGKALSAPPWPPWLALPLPCGGGDAAGV